MGRDLRGRASALLRPHPRRGPARGRRAVTGAHQGRRVFDLVVIDTLAGTSAGLEEEQRQDMGVYINNCYTIRDSAKEAGATVLVVHHTGYDTKRARGSLGAVRQR